MNKKKIAIILSILAVYGVSTGLSYALFSQTAVVKKEEVVSSSAAIPGKNGGEGMTFDETLPKTEPCPLNGELFSKQQRDWWDKHRPLGIMIENHANARPQSGLSAADVVYEAVAEGGITRLLALYHCQDAGTVGPIRSARVYFLHFVSEYGKYPLYTHVGGANTPGPADALSQIYELGWNSYNDLNQFSIGFPTFWRDYDRLGHTTATEHTMYSTTTRLWEFAKTRGLSNVDKEGKEWDGKFVSYSFKDDAPVSQRGSSQTVHVEFWSGYGEYFVDWAYDSKSNRYTRSHGASSHVDRNNNEQLSAKNIVVLFMQESSANDGYENNIHLLYKTRGTGKAAVFLDGKRINGTWRKEEKAARTLLFDENNQPLKLNRGTLWFEIVPTTGVVTDK